jgi:TatD DNase family protein
MNFIDTHTHLFLAEFDNDLDNVIGNALSKGVSKFLLPNIDKSTTKRMLEISKQYPNKIFPMIGLHPTSVKKDFEEELKDLEYWLEKEKFCAIGEIGIDLYWDKTYKNEQIKAFKKQIELAIQHNLPIVIHTRQAFETIFEILNEFKELPKGVFHCFSGSLDQANQAIDMGFKLGIGGVVTYKNGGLDKIVKEIDLKHIVLETDSPYLTPVPYRGKRNESAYILHIAEKLSSIKDISIEEVAKTTTENATKLFNLQ